ncbi:hypothetical protein [Cetobacterium sp.]|uniref:hypothetical protein n=1 Tax=Cetobacterium sp. TaxID=2071632 RepID=UPI0025C3D0B1|nr:hypothetical protein [Cetobacterium sp.]
MKRIIENFLKEESNLNFSLVMMSLEKIKDEKERNKYLDELLKKTKSNGYRGMLYICLYRFLEGFYYLKKEINSKEKPESFLFLNALKALSSTGAINKIIELNDIEIDEEDENYHQILILLKVNIFNEINKEVLCHINSLLAKEYLTDFDFILILKCSEIYKKNKIDHKLLTKIRKHKCFKKEYYEYIKSGGY